LYEIYNGLDLIDTIEGTVTSYTFAASLAGPGTAHFPGDPFQFSVVAQWGNHKSRPSAPVSGKLMSPPVTGELPVHVMTTSVPGMGASLSVGYHWDDSWGFLPSCHGDSCTIKAEVDIEWTPGVPSTTYDIPLSASGATYSGTAKAPNATHCKKAESADTLTMTLTAKGPVVNGAWQAWAGTMVLAMSATTASGNYFCPAQSWKFAVSG
jgi:hypothetical protein